MALAAQALRSALTGKFGFTCDGSGRGPHDKFRLIVGGVYLTHTQISRGSFDMGDPIIGMIGRQLGVSRRQVYEMVDCRLDRERYLSLIL